MHVYISIIIFKKKRKDQPITPKPGTRIKDKRKKDKGKKDKENKTKPKKTIRKKDNEKKRQNEINTIEKKT